MDIQAAMYKDEIVLSSASPINNLPPEIISHIFTLASESTRCFLGDGAFNNYDSNIPMLPDILPHVCSRWRRISLDTHSLWAHIDIVTSQALSKKLISRAELFIARLEPAQPDIHITTPLFEKPFSEHSPSTQMWLEKISWFTASTMQCFRLRVSNNRDFAWIVDQFLPQVMPEMLTELELSDQSSDSQSERPLEEKFGLTKRAQLFNEILRPVKILRLCNVWFSPASHVYKGLVDLRLHTDSEDKLFVPILSLMNILASCPGLRIFHSSVGLSTETRKLSIEPASLKELEVLHLRGISRLLLPHIQPGSKQLYLYLPVELSPHQSYSGFFPSLISDFFDRSHVTKLFLDDLTRPGDRGNSMSYPSLAMLISELPDSLCSLHLQGFHLSHNGETPSSWVAHLSTIHIYSCDIDTISLRIIPKLCPIQELVLKNSTIRSNEHDRNAIKEEVSKLAPVVDIISSTFQTPENQ